MHVYDENKRQFDEKKKYKQRNKENANKKRFRININESKNLCIFQELISHGAPAECGSKSGKISIINCTNAMGMK